MEDITNNPLKNNDFYNYPIAFRSTFSDYVHAVLRSSDGEAARAGKPSGRTGRWPGKPSGGQGQGSGTSSGGSDSRDREAFGSSGP